MKKITAILALLLVQNSYALELAGINGVEILAINGEKVKSSLFTSSDNELQAGKHQVVVRYSTQFNNDTLIESKPAIFTIDLTQDTQISVKNINNQRQAEKQIKSGLTWQIVSEDKRYQVKDADMLQGQGFMPYSDIEKLISDYNQQNNISLATAAVPATLATKAVVDTKPQTNIEGENALISLYQQASKEQKKAFRLWLVEQEMK